MSWQPPTNVLALVSDADEPRRPDFALDDIEGIANLLHDRVRARGAATKRGDSATPGALDEGV